MHRPSFPRKGIHFLLNEQVASQLITGAVDAGVSGWPHRSDHAPFWIEVAD